ncbi:tetraacyldisaccharide 4'-kinase [Chlamydiifrater phoenicopteri]|uniref:tetraacyldisaccharide 4'-kinase n=1 Tax=Chlamydiifrater phoenicopteri TaxID=2681469 RepID=UPI001BD13129|nr:tetraacyldisaccharide 4'-kinase [Chlamydiifrater phoenicopteri]
MTPKNVSKDFPSSVFMIYRALSLRLLKRRSSIFTTVLSSIFAFCSRLHKLVFTFKRKVTAGIPVVSVGNIAVGGTGKTPIVVYLLEFFHSKGLQCAVLSRGYKGKLSSRSKSVLVNPSLHTAKEVGDEPLMLSQKIANGFVIIGKNRLLSVKKAEELGCDVAILDDGLQYLPLKKQANIVVVRGEDPLGGGKFFPKGLLRDRPNVLKSADLIAINGKNLKEASCSLESFKTVPKIYFRQVFDKLLIVHGCFPDKGASLLEGVGAGVFCGLGSPESFVRTVEESGVKVLARYILPDHAAITMKELRFLSAKTALRKGEILLCTEKDFVKMPDLSGEKNLLPIGVICSRAVVGGNQEVLNDLLNKICRLCERRKR